MRKGETSRPHPWPPPAEDVDGLLAAAGRGDDAAFELVPTGLSGSIQRPARTVVRDPAQSEEVTQRCSSRCGNRRPLRVRKGSAVARALTVARRRAVERVRSTTARSAREQRNVVAGVSWNQVSEAVVETLDREQLRRYRAVWVMRSSGR